MLRLVALLLVTILLQACQLHAKQESQVVAVSLHATEQGYQIFRDGTPFFIKGVGGHTRLDKLAESGGNAIRTWSTDNAGAILDEAHKRGLVVMLGLRLGHERHGFDYSNNAAVAEQFERVKKTVMQYKDHPALLAWGIGNEVDLFYTDTAVWYAVEDIAAFIQDVDPHHLVTTVTAGIDKQKLDLITERVPSIDYLSINIYGGLETLPADLLDYGYTGPYVVTEWGPTGHWQVGKTSWDVPVEQTSTEKAASYRARYQDGIVNARDRALGSFAFLWGQKQETTPTWYGVFTERGNPTEVVDSLTYNWTGSWPTWRAPSLAELTINGNNRFDNVTVTRSAQLFASAGIITRSDVSPSVRWEVLPESTDIRAGGDPESRPQSLTNLNIRRQSENSMRFNAPENAGAYRLFVYITDNQGRVATANIPFLVE